MFLKDRFKYLEEILILMVIHKTIVIHKTFHTTYIDRGYYEHLPNLEPRRIQRSSDEVVHPNKREALEFLDEKVNQFFIRNELVELLSSSLTESRPYKIDVEGRTSCAQDPIMACDLYRLVTYKFKPERNE